MTKVYDDCDVCLGEGTSWNIDGSEGTGPCPLCAMRARAEAAEAQLSNGHKALDVDVTDVDILGYKLSITGRVMILRQRLERVELERDAATKRADEAQDEIQQLNSYLKCAVNLAERRGNERDSARRSAAAWKRAAKLIFSEFGWGLVYGCKIRNSILSWDSGIRRYKRLADKARKEHNHAS